MWMVQTNYQNLDATGRWKMVNQHDSNQTKINSTNTIILKMKSSWDKWEAWSIKLLVKENETWLERMEKLSPHISAVTIFNYGINYFLNENENKILSWNKFEMIWNNNF